MQLILITGLSGSGKSIALKVLEDASYYCIDNLPSRLLPAFIEFATQNLFGKIAVSVDARSGKEFFELLPQIEALKQIVADLRVIFLDATTETLVKRFSETRRRHPLADDMMTLQECIESEREILAPIAETSLRIDTSDINANTLRAWIKDLVSIDRSRLTLVLISFGFKQGIPLDADTVFDIRCLPNPFYNPLLKALTGKDSAVAEFIQADFLAQQMLGDIRGYLEKWLPEYARDNRSYFTVGIGCTGGQHRSVYFAEKLGEHFRESYQVLVRHRELDSY